MFIRVVFSIALVSTFLCDVRGSRPRFWSLATQADFLKGNFKGVALTSDGRLILAPEFELVFDTGQPFVYSVTTDGNGNTYLGTGGDGKIFRVSPSGQGVEIADLEEPGVQGLVVASNGDLFAATAPAGRVYRIRSGGSPESFFRPEDRYIWDLTAGPDGDLYVATGPQGKIYRVDAQSGEGRVFYDSKEEHFVDLAWDIDSNLLAGSSPAGLLMRVDGSGTAFVLHDSKLEEMRGIRLDRYGNIYAAGISFKPPEIPTTASVTVTASASPATPPAPRESQADSKTVMFEGVRKGERIELYRIDREGLVETLYGRDDHGVLDLLVRESGEIVMGTSHQGRLLSLTTARLVKVIGDAPDEQVTRLLASGDAILAATSNLGKLYRLSDASATGGVYESEALDAGVTSRWGQARWQVVNPAGDTIGLSTRSGNTAKPDSTWSEWQEVDGSSDGASIGSPQARFLQWRIRFEGDAGATGILSERNGVDSVEISYLQRNVPPLITSLTLHGPGAAFVKTPTASPAGGAPIGGPSNAYLRSLPNRVRRLNAATTVRPRSVYIPGARSVSWTATDPNGDDLVYDVYLRRLGDSNWIPVATDLEDRFYTLDGVSIPPGTHLFRIVASDRVSNPPDLAARAERQSKPFSVANQPPSIEIEHTTGSGSAVTVSVTARTTAASVYQLEYSLDGGDWIIVHPEDGIADSPRESFRFDTPGLASGRHQLRVRVIDAVGNVGTGGEELNVP